MSCNRDITNRNREQRWTDTRIWQHRKTDYISLTLQRELYIRKKVECELTAHYHMQEYWGKTGITLVWPGTKIIRNGEWRNVNQIMHSKVQTDKTITNNKTANIIRDNEKGTCLLMEVAISWESAILTFSVKGINLHSINRWQYGTEQVKVPF